MSKTSKLYQVVCHSSRLDGTKVFKLFVVTLDQNTITTNKSNVPFEKGICHIYEKLMTPFFGLRFSEVLSIVQEN